MLSSQSQKTGWRPVTFLDMVFLQRMRTIEDRHLVIDMFNRNFPDQQVRLCPITLTISEEPLSEGDEVPSVRAGPTSFSTLAGYRRMQTTPDLVQIGKAYMGRHPSLPHLSTSDSQTTHSDPPPLVPLPPLMGVTEHLLKCVEMSWMPILIGPPASGKTSLVKMLAKLKGRNLHTFAMNSSVDTMELLGGYEQVEEGRYRRKVVELFSHLVEATLQSLFVIFCSSSSSSSSSLPTPQACSEAMIKLLDLWQNISDVHLSSSEKSSSKGTKYKMVKNLLSLIKEISSSFSIPFKSSSDEDVNGVKKGDGCEAAVAQIVASSPSYEAAMKVLGDWERVEAMSACGRFEWVDGMLLRAMAEGLF